MPCVRHFIFPSTKLLESPIQPSINIMPTDTDSRPFPKGLVSRSGILVVVLVYAAFAALWILLSDKLLEWLFTDPLQIILLSTLKGWLFVACTSLLLYGLMRRLVGAASHPEPGVSMSSASQSGLKGWILPFALLVTAVLALTGVVTQTVIDQRDKEVARLQAVAELKVQQVGDWLQEKTGDAEFLQADRFFAESYRRWRDAGDLVSRDRLQEGLEQLGRHRGYTAVLLLDAQGARLWGSARAPAEIAESLRDAARLASKDLQVHRVGPYRGVKGTPGLDFVVPVTSAGENPPIIVLHADPTDWLSHTLQLWPVASASGEMLLFRRAGDQILYLNELRYLKDTTAKLQVSLAGQQSLVARALSGNFGAGGLVGGEDYRGQMSVGMIRAVPGTDWFLLAKLDKDELYNEAIQKGVWIGLASLLALCMAVLGFYLLRQRQQLALVVKLQQSQAERLRALSLVGAIADCSDDAIFAKDLEGRFILFNRAASHFVGKTAEEVLGRDEQAIFPSEQAERLMAGNRLAIKENRTHTREEILSLPDGDRVFLTTKGPLRDAEGNVIGIFGIARDITERKQAEAALRASELSYRSLFENLMNSVVHGRIIFEGEKPVDLEYIATNPAFAKVTGIAEPVIGRRISEVIPGYCRNHPESIEMFGRVAVTGVSTHWEHYLRELDRWFSFMIYSPKYGEVVIVTENITQRKQAELALRESEIRFRALVEQSLAGIYIVQDNRFRYVNPGFAGIFGYDSADEVIERLAVADLVCPEDRDRVAENIRRRLTGEISDMHYCFSGLRKNGNRIDVEVHGRGFDYQERPAVIGFLLDITERKAVEAQLRTSEERLQLALEATRDGLWDWDFRSGLAYLSSQYYEMTGYRADEVKPDFEFFKSTVHPDDLAHVLEIMDAHLQGKTPDSEVDYRLVTRSGEIKWMRGRGRVVERDASGAPLRMIGTIRDITVRKAGEEALRRQTQELAQRNEELERFNQATVGREMDMIALKRQVNELSRQLGQQPPYPLAFMDEQPQQKLGDV